MDRGVVEPAQITPAPAGLGGLYREADFAVEPGGLVVGLGFQALQLKLVHQAVDQLAAVALPAEVRCSTDVEQFALATLQPDPRRADQAT